MDITKNIAKAVLNKNYAEAKESIFKSLYAKASLAMDEARYYIADALFNRSAEGDAETVSEDNWGGGFQTSKEAWREEMKKMRAEAKWNKDKAKRAAKKAKAAKKAVKEEAEQVDETWKSLKKTKANLDAIRKTGKRVAVQHGEGDTLYKVMKPKKAVKEEAEQIDETWKSLKKTKANLDAIRKTGKRVAVQHGEGDTLYKVMKPKKAVKEEAEQIDEVSPPGMEKMTGSKKTKASFAKQYGKRGKEVMYATAWKLHNKKAGKD